MSEIWKLVVGWEEAYEVSSLGRVRSKERTFLRRHNKTDKLVSYTYKSRHIHQWIGTHTGYPMVNLQFKWQSKAVAVHVLVLEAFVGDRPDGGYVACHNDGSRVNNTLQNLRWDTYQGNEADKLKHDTHVRGERNWKARLTESDVISVRQRLASGETCASIAKGYGVTPEAINHIKLKKTWAWLGQEAA